MFMKRKVIVGISVLLVLVVAGFFVFLLSRNNSTTETEYEKALKYIENRNQWTIDNNYDEHCNSDYRYYDRGCYYSTTEIGSIINYEYLDSFNLDSSQILEICKKLVHKGEAAYCLNHYNYTDECLDFAESTLGEYCAEYNPESITQPPACLVFGNISDYLKRICSLKKGQVIYSKRYSPSQEECDLNGCFPSMSYSNFI